jgi:nucleoside-triphosphatase
MILDECGQLEQEAVGFQQAVMDVLNENIPVLGVLKETQSPWLENLRRHPAVTVLEVTQANRDDMTLQLLRQFTP